MGSSHSLEDDLITFKLTSKQMARSAKKCEKNELTAKENLRKAIEKGNIEGARIYAQNAIREKNNGLNFMRLGSRIDAVASRLETAIRMQQVNKAMGMTVKGMTAAMRSMNVEEITRTMETFEKQFEDMDVKSAYMEGAMESSTALSTPPEQVEALMQQVADEHGLTISTQMDTVSTTIPAGDVLVMDCYSEGNLMTQVPQRMT